MKIFFITIILTLINLLTAEITTAQFLEYLEKYPEAGNYNSNPKLFLFMKIIPPKTKKQRRRLDYNARIIQTFINNLGIRNEIMNLENKHYIAIIPAQNEFLDKDIILSTFKDLISHINILSPDVFKKENEAPKNMDL